MSRLMRALVYLIFIFIMVGCASDSIRVFKASTNTNFSGFVFEDNGTVRILGADIERRYASAEEPPGSKSFIEDDAYILSSAIWPYKNIYVCWENPKDENIAMRKVVRKSISETWEKHSTVAFLYWGKCKDTSTGIRIKIEDDEPHTKYLGRGLDGEPSGILLNLEFLNWGQGCRNGGGVGLTVEKCVAWIAAHEFGHALGFSHEQNRTDTNFDNNNDGKADKHICTASTNSSPDGDREDLTPWDPESIMNYCNLKYKNHGKLSKWDIHALRCVYDQEEYDCDKKSIMFAK